MTNRNILAIALLAVLTVSCAEKAPEAVGEHAVAEAHATSSSAGLPAGHIAAGEKLANTKGAATGQSCIDCHGADGNTPIDPTYPRLGGQYHDYLAYALQGYRDGKRDHALMSSQAKSLSDQQIADLSVYFGSRESKLRDLHGAHDAN